ncbi:hypothetical protein KOW79_011924 [Hemibagrus wyckioides]|uniref:Uncharacterized protein n=1 Tax=Hemibagrus wyckioides TaxID=337641 RepID=A0A9D3NJR5_9TELE|nr:hypothetical protein KOW79_011900 [Hemibagrus wyckioides]KAG7323888.1 hypothetical protein KOW79_011904 [Hemibagrus wyckioides]KAG7323892.1 hypothetical protein KOW79_011908 [Hemibagrus wyckioides]KAG7323896.1 hypothetical protein KOW79_011912 [Hemibagrus wyckioides]KAG7323900.1 hypothetical protein KOW79_011916 [Hemibagrus wyckioides]
MPEAVHLGDLLRIWVRPGARFTPSPPDFQGPARAHRTPPEPRRFPGRGPLSRGEPIPGRPALHKEKRTLPGAPAGVSGSRLNICYYHQDLHLRRLHPGPRPRLPRHRSGPPTRRGLGPEAFPVKGTECACDGRVWARRSSAIHFQG